jgi:N-acetylglucosaminyltransferase
MPRNDDQSPTGSIVVPALDEERVIGSCLGSLAQQDYPGRLDVIVVDNGSSGVGRGLRHG